MNDRNPALATLYVITGVALFGGAILAVFGFVALESAMGVQEPARTLLMIYIGSSIVGFGVLVGLLSLHAAAIGRSTRNAIGNATGR